MIGSPRGGNPGLGKTLTFVSNAFGPNSESTDPLFIWEATATRREADIEEEFSA